jgi:hypothetical protein
MKRVVALLSLFILSVAATAQNLPVENQLLDEEPVVRRYSVELVVFAYTEDVSTGTELFIADEPVVVEDETLLADDAVIDAEGLLVDDSVADEVPIDPQDAEDLEQEPPFILLPEEEYLLIDVIHQFELLDAYETLLHVAWTQPTYPAEDTLPIELHTLGAVPDRLNGSVTLYLSRYLHLVIDLSLDATEENVGFVGNVDEPAFGFGDPRHQDDPYGFDIIGNPNEGIVRYRLQENRIVKNGEMRYFDHPKFGVVAKVTRIEEDPEPEEESYDESRQLLGRIDQ